ncbi:MAG TPA: SpoIIE family protein phosphatase [Candidatus Limnocylindria bacterium]|jgi:sigma-B regulation protein RsbU (phosphoserine phosphatase)|nr:SpoIIE family protein phosphatase [Candidatus Limnocylindria bacterium]
MSDNSRAEILVVDDDPISRRVLAKLLTAAGYKCRVCNDGSEALKAVHPKPPSLLLLDFDMPGINGAEVLTRLRSDGHSAVSQIPTILLTAHGSEESEVSCLQAGADDFVTKPVNAAVLRARIETQLRLRSMRRQLERQNDELEKWRRDLERDLAAARLTQQSLIPQKPLALPGWEVATCYRPVIQVGGDIYGWLRMKDGRILFWIADGTGHGAAAALLTTLAKLLFHHGNVEQDTPASVMEAVNHDFRSIFRARSFMTAMCVALDPATGSASLVGAGHPPLLVVRRNGTTESIASVAPPLGVIDQPEFAETAIDLQPGDAFLLYTDGLFRWAKDDRRRLNPQQLEKMMGRSAPSAEALLKAVLVHTAPDTAVKTSPDDMTVLAVRRNGGQ